MTPQVLVELSSILGPFHLAPAQWTLLDDSPGIVYKVQRLASLHS